MGPLSKNLKFQNSTLGKKFGGYFVVLMLLFTSCNSFQSSETGEIEDLMEQNLEALEEDQIGFLIKIPWELYQSCDLNEILTPENLKNGYFTWRDYPQQLQIPSAFIEKRPIYMLVLYRKINFRQGRLDNDIAIQNGRIVDDTEVVYDNLEVLSEEVRLLSTTASGEIEQQVMLGYENNPVNSWGIFKPFNLNWEGGTNERVDFYNASDPLARWLFYRMDSYSSLQELEALKKNKEVQVFKLEGGSFTPSSLTEMQSLKPIPSLPENALDIAASVERNLDDEMYSFSTTCEKKTIAEEEEATELMEEQGHEPEVEAPPLFSIEDPDGYTNLRATPGGTVVRKVLENETFEILETGDTYSQVKFADGSIGFIHNSRIKAAN
jgi:hypothetical protein